MAGIQPPETGRIALKVRAAHAWRTGCWLVTHRCCSCPNSGYDIEHLTWLLREVPVRGLPARIRATG